MKWSGGQRADGFNWGVLVILLVTAMFAITAPAWGSALDRAVIASRALWFPWGVLALGLIIGTLMLR
jgi:hypothetical protein